MALNIILILFIIISLVIILSIVFKKLPQLNRVKPGKIPLFREKKIKKDILEKKLKRDLDLSKRKLLLIIKPLVSSTSIYIKKGYQYIYNLEEKYRKKLRKTHFEDKISIKGQITGHLEKAERFIGEKNLNRAEDEYINALKLDIHNLDIYKKLADLYFKDKDYEKAKETYEYIVKLQDDDYVYSRLGDISSNKGDLNQAILNYKKSISIKNDNPVYYYNLAKINLKLDKLEDSLDNIKKALNIEPYNPKLLDFLLDLSIIMGDKDLANKTLNKLIEVNPGNKRILELRKKINKI